MRPIEALLEIIRDEGVTRIFGNPGTTELPLMDALVEAPDLEYVLGLQEGSVVAMADGYARASRRTAFVSLHVAAGVANGMIGMLNALRSRTPMVIVAGQQDRRHLLQDPMLSGDLVGLASAATKFAFEVQHARDLPLVLRRAFALAARPPAGPVLISVPMDLLEEDVDVAVPARSPVSGPGPAVAGVAEAAALLAAAERPVVIAGDGVGRAGAVQALVAVAEGLGATVYHQPMNDGIDFPGGHPLYAGMLAPRNTAIRETLAEHDAALIVGCHAFMPHHYTPGSAVPDGLDIVQIDEDPAEIGRNFPVRHGLTGDLAATLRALADRLDVPSAPDRAQRIGAATDQARAAVESAARDAYGPVPMDPGAAAHAVAAGLPADAVVVEEAITTGLRLRAVLRQDRPGSYVHTVGGGLGWGIGAAVGTRLADPDRPVVAVLGDGCAMFGLQGLWSAARYEVPVAFVVMNNGEYRTLKDTLDQGGGASAEHGRYVGMDLTGPALDWQAAGRLFDIDTVRPESADALRDAVASVKDLTRPLLIEARITGHGR
ncbi:thiamine pyrophosphate-binding protein [Actinomadura sp. NEAU-AAG7]|uniref:thiamine pyrophosphate-binding protein n=1 Tax=Actinomadura sp. NEAU-AAG7 TaxID=2839640 RepID=UPI001BE41CFD|nr:thiamine pyrophosphate-binding protein [Actinomadura sp. NEAU-AAG7]MBT2214117.1 thiamine pyrophosphate-binding protein [Actinomadura sp. NEAU-AAG7]